MNYSETVVRAVADVSLDIPIGSVLGLVGESGCGKSTLGRIAAGLLPATDGKVQLDGNRIDRGNTDCDLQTLLRVQMVFQNPMASLNPRQRVLDIITEGPLYHGFLKPSDKRSFAAALLEEVGLTSDALTRLPHQFSGGQRQRIGIARALSMSPDFLICDEPVAALDVSIQAQIINLLMELQVRRNLTILFISHDLGVVRHLCDEVAVMYLGRIVERGKTQTIFDNPSHPYTEALLKEMPSVKSGNRVYEPVKGEIPSPIDPPPGCHFHPRCRYAMEKCHIEAPPQFKVASRHLSSCWRLNDPEC
ncbi:UNVERIFIED_CONTAM: hypothetical protein GTU68_022397 [Idotea baltica]|nr:hypothetical protein [Idotea baltica]